MKAAHTARLLVVAVLSVAVVSPAAAAIPPGAVMPGDSPGLPIAPAPVAPPRPVAPPMPFGPVIPASPITPVAPVMPADPSPPVPATNGAPPGGVIPPTRVALTPHFAYRLGDPGGAISPRAGYGLAGTIEINYLRIRGGVEAALGIDFGFDRFSTAEQGAVTINGREELFGSTRVVSETSFVLIHTMAFRAGRARPFVCVGAGLGLGYFESFEATLRPGTASDTHLLGRVSLGLDLAVTSLWAVTIRADYTAVRRTSPFVTEGGRTLPLFGDLFAIGPGIAYRF